MPHGTDARLDGETPRRVLSGGPPTVWKLTGLCLSLVLLAGAATAENKGSLLLATTTSIQDTGLLDALLPRFTRESGIEVRAVAVGTGAALRMGAEGNADVLLTHAPSAEAELVASGAVESRVEIMENYFVLAGPEHDPANVREAKDVQDALRRIQESGAAFVSRADDSGTHKREVALLTSAGLSPKASWPGSIRTGAGMGMSLQVAGQNHAYVLSDAGTFLAFQQHAKLAALSRPEPALRNVYSVLRVSPEKFPRVRAKEARALEAFLIDPATQAEIARFGLERFGRALFFPISNQIAGSGAQSEAKEATAEDSETVGSAN